MRLKNAATVGMGCESVLEEGGSKWGKSRWAGRFVGATGIVEASEAEASPEEMKWKRKNHSVKSSRTTG